jgi:hypothetical protein
MRAPAHAIVEAPGGSTDDRFEIVTCFENQDGPCSTYLCCDLANFVDTASRAVQITQVHRDPVYPALVTVNGETDASLDMLSQFFIPGDMSRSNSDFHRYLLLLFVHQSLKQLQGHEKHQHLHVVARAMIRPLPERAQ